MIDILIYVFVAYLTVGFSKMVLVLAQFPLVYRTVMLLNKKYKSLPKDETPMVTLFVMLSLTVTIALLVWPPLLITEKLRFFILYSRYNIVRQVVEGFRLAVGKK